MLKCEESPARDWTPALSADGRFYCSPACGGGKFCLKEWHDHAVGDAEATRAELGEGWRIDVWENLGWHARLKKGCVTVYVPSRGRPQDRRFSAWIEPNVVVGSSRLQIIAYGETASDALGFATQDARTVIERMRQALEELHEVVDL